MISTSKLPLETKEISTTSYYSRGTYCYYMSDSEGVSIEQIADNMIGEKAIFLHKEHNRVRLIFTHTLNDTVELEKPEDLKPEKITSVVGIAMMQLKTTVLYVLEGSEVSPNLAITLKTLTHKDLEVALKKVPNLKTLKTQLLKILLLVVLFFVLWFAQDFLFNYLRTNSEHSYQAQKQELLAQADGVQKEYKKLEKTISELPTAIAKNYDEIVDEL